MNVLCGAQCGDNKGDSESCPCPCPCMASDRNGLTNDRHSPHIGMVVVKASFFPFLLGRILILL